MKSNVKIDLSSTIEKVFDISALELSPSIGKAYWDMESKSNELFSQALKNSDSDKENSNYWSINTEDSHLQKTYIQRYDKDTNICYFWNARDPSESEYYLEVENTTHKSCLSMKYTQIFKSSKGLISFVDNGGITIYYMKRFYVIKELEFPIPENGFVQLSAKIEKEGQPFPLTVMVNPTGCFSNGDCDSVFRITISSVKASIKNEFLMHDTEELKKYSDIRWSFCTFREVNSIIDEEKLG
jgi:hypothetical protein